MIFKLLAAGRQFLVAAGSDESQVLSVCEQVTAVSESPEAVAISLPSKGALFDAICRTHEFTLAIPPKDAADRVAKCSRAQKSARFVDMFSECSLTPGKAQMIGAPIIEEAEVNIECRLSSIVSFGDRSLIIGEVVHLGISDEKKEEKSKQDAKDEKPASNPKDEKQKTDQKDDKRDEKKDERPRQDAADERTKPA
jgi:flavin reductase (DIM6/NTAB) family NADH-FMN oxidoreductase RutF